MKKVDEHGNLYKFTRTDTGIATFEHVQTGQLLHSHNGPYEEAWKMYVKNCDVLTRASECTVYDLGLGCGSQVLAMRDAFFKNPRLTKLNIVSFDLETLGLNSVVEHIDEFEFAKPHFNFLTKATQSHVVNETFDDGRSLNWRFVEGDFVKTAFQNDLPKANVICCDFFSVSAHPHLWTYSIMKRLWDLSADDCVFITYSSATSVRASLLASGFYVGFSPDLIENFRMTIASKQQNKIEVPLNYRWLQKFERSSLPFLDIEDDETKKHITQAVKNHPQFR